MVSPSHATPLLGLSLALALSLFSPLPLSNYCCYHCCFYCIYILPTTTVVPPFLTRLSLPPISLPLLSYSSFSSLATNFSFSFSLSPPSIRYVFVGGSFGTPKIVPPPPYPIPKRSFFNSSPPTPLQQHNYHHHHHHHDATPLDQRCHETTLDSSTICSQIPLMETLIPLFFRVTTHQ